MTKSILSVLAASFVIPACAFDGVPSSESHIDSTRQATISAGGGCPPGYIDNSGTCVITADPESTDGTGIRSLTPATPTPPSGPDARGECLADCDDNYQACIAATPRLLLACKRALTSCTNVCAR